MTLDKSIYHLGSQFTHLQIKGQLSTVLKVHHEIYIITYCQSIFSGAETPFTFPSVKATTIPDIFTSFFLFDFDLKVRFKNQ